MTVTMMSETARYFISIYTDGPSKRWNVIDRRTQDWIRRFPSEKEAQAYVDFLNKGKGGKNAKAD